MRGAVSVALAYAYFDWASSKGGKQSGADDSSSEQHRSTLIVATLVVVLTTVLVLGNLTNTLTQVMGRLHCCLCTLAERATRSVCV